MCSRVLGCNRGETLEWVMVRPDARWGGFRAMRSRVLVVGLLFASIFLGATTSASIVTPTDLVSGSTSASGAGGIPNVVSMCDMPMPFPYAHVEMPTSGTPSCFFVDTARTIGECSRRAGALIPDTRGGYVQKAQAKAWYRVNSSEVASPAMEFRYFAFDVVTRQVTKWFEAPDQSQPISGHLGELREWAAPAPVTVDYQLLPDEVLGFASVFPGGDASATSYEYAYCLDSPETPTRVEVWRSSQESTTYYVRWPDDCPSRRTYTDAFDFGQGLLMNVRPDPEDDGQLRLDESKPLPFIWFALSGRHTVAKVNTETGEVLGEYWSTANLRGGGRG